MANNDVAVNRVFSDETRGTIYRVDAAKHYFHFRMTPTGMLRIGPIKKRGEGEGVINGG